MRRVLMLLIVLSMIDAILPSFGSAAESATPQPVTGSINDALGRPLSNVAVTLQASDGHTVAETTTSTTGQFSFPAVAPGNYAITAEKGTFKKATAVVAVGTKPPVPVVLALESSAAIDLKVTAQRLDKARNGLSPETGSSTYRFTQQSINQLPQSENTPFNQVLLQAPGVAQDSLGQIHIRGEHANIQYRINGIELPEGLTGFGQALNPRFANTINLATGALPAQYGFRTSGIVDIHTKNGAIDQGGSVQMYGGQNATYEPSFELGGTSGALSYFATGDYFGSDRGIEPPTAGPTAIHDHTDQGTGFFYLSYFLNPTTRIGLISGVNINSFQIPQAKGGMPQFMLTGYSNFPSQNIAEGQFEQTYYNVLALQGTLAEQFDYQLAAFSRYSTIDFSPDFAGDLLYTGLSSHVFRSSFANGLQSDNAYRLNDQHTIRGGFYWSGEPVTIDNHAFVFPADPMTEMQTSDVPTFVVDDTNKTTWLYGAYVQDEWKPFAPLTINGGIRYDLVDGFTHSDQFSPRIGAVYDLPTKTILHAGYARYFTPPPSELVAAADVMKFQGTTAQPEIQENTPPRSERAHYFDVGVIQGLIPGASVGIDSYYKYSDYVLDEGQFSSALIFTPFNYRYGRQYGVEATASYTAGNLNAYANFAYSVAQGERVISSQFTFDQDEFDFINNHFVFLDHDQTFTSSGGASYAWNGFGFRFDYLYGSGLRSGFANTGNLPFYIQANAGISKRVNVPYLGWAEVRLDCVNVFDHTYEIRNGTGIGVGATQFGPRRTFLGGIRVPLPFTEPTATS